MTDLTTQIANVKSLLAFLENQLPKEEVVEKPKKETKKKDDKTIVVEEKPKKEVKKKDEKPEKKDEKPEKKEEKPVAEEKVKKALNIPRMTDKIKQVLVKSLKTIANVDSDEKILDKFKKYINQDMTAEKFESDSLENHVTTFVRLNFVKGGNDVQSPFVGLSDPPTVDWSNASENPPMHKLQKTVSVEQFEAMKKSKILKPLGNDNYWSPDDGMWILVDGDDDVYDHILDGETFLICKENKRVYKHNEDTGKDIFVGFVGIGDFKSFPL